ncbi:hypothetical protein RhiirC2_713318 [Rhizophagus irregularis]|uniref:Integrase catalytic domain-containing protein n=1 Tax=Rhizophagus irregularis TaxID=588596 RepID=A0A2N1N3S2_9GLOM|nr:hypothetical protein RhiirC2_713318 [Rhizophagus irregularis]
MHQANVLYTRYVKSKRTIYLFYLNVKDVASRYEAIVPIGVALKGPAKSIKNMQGILTSSTIAKCLEKIYDNPENPLIWPKVFLSDRRSEFKGECEKLLRKHGVRIQKAKSKKTMELEDLAGVVDSIVEDLNNSITRLLNDEGNGPEKSFVREEFQIVPPDVEYPPQWIIPVLMIELGFGPVQSYKQRSVDSAIKKAIDENWIVPTQEGHYSEIRLIQLQFLQRCKSRRRRRVQEFGIRGLGLWLKRMMEYMYSEKIMDIYFFIYNVY